MNFSFDVFSQSSFFEWRESTDYFTQKYYLSISAGVHFIIMVFMTAPSCDKQNQINLLLFVYIDHLY